MRCCTASWLAESGGGGGLRATTPRPLGRAIDKELGPIRPTPKSDFMSATHLIPWTLTPTATGPRQRPQRHGDLGGAAGRHEAGQDHVLTKGHRPTGRIYRLWSSRKRTAPRLRAPSPPIPPVGPGCAPPEAALRHPRRRGIKVTVAEGKQDRDRAVRGPRRGRAPAPDMGK